MRFRGIVCATILSCASPFCVHAQDGEAWNVTLDSVVVKSHANTSGLKTGVDGSVRWDLRQMQSLPKLLGDADPIRYAQMLPGLQTNDEYHSGLHVQGCDNQHNVVSINGIPLYHVSHLMGFFSSFVSSHFAAMSLSKNPPSAAMSNRLGAVLDMRSPEAAADSSSGEFSVGLIASQGTYRWVIDRSTMLSVSLRASYMKYLYGHWLKADDKKIDYSFHDVNATLVHRLNDRNTLMVDFYSGSDHAGMLENHYMADMQSSWGNAMGAAHWLYRGDSGVRAEGALYVTAYHNRFNLSLQDMMFNLRSRIVDLGLKGQFSHGRWSGGVEALYHWIRPQSLERTGGYNESDGTVPLTKSVETSLFVNYCQPLCDRLFILSGLRGSMYHGESVTQGGLDPFVGMSYDDQVTQLLLSYSRKHQYLFQTGFSDMGLPTEFWMSSSGEFPAQQADLLDFSFNRFLFKRGYKITLDLFYKKLYHQVDYVGTVLDFMNKNYDIDQALKSGKGENYGFSVMLHKTSGRLNGWVCYGYLNARRVFSHQDAGRDSFVANHSRPHELNLVLCYSCGSHWDFGASVVWATGTPYTVAESLLLLNGNVVVNYGEHNGRRLRPYMRTDLSVNYKWKPRVFKECGLNFSVYNVTNHDNELFHYLKTNSEGMFAYRAVSSVLNMLPSFSFYCKL